MEQRTHRLVTFKHQIDVPCKAEATLLGSISTNKARVKTGVVAPTHCPAAQKVKQLCLGCTRKKKLHLSFKISNDGFYIKTFQGVMIGPVLVCLKQAPRSHKTSTRGLESSRC